MNRVIEVYNRGYRCTYDGKMLNPKGEEIGFSNNQNYHQISIRLKGVSVNVKSHRLQAFQKYGHKMFDKGIEVRHLNGDKEDFSWDNILIGTHSENMMDIPKHVRLKTALKATEKVRKYDKKEVIDFHLSNGKSYKKTMSKFNISSKGTLHYILNNNN